MEIKTVDSPSSITSQFMVFILSSSMGLAGTYSGTSILYRVFTSGTVEHLSFGTIKFGKGILTHGYAALFQHITFLCFALLLLVAAGVTLKKILYGDTF